MAERVENVVVLGMGGSGIAGDVLVAAAAPFMPVPITVVKGYEPPDSVGTGSLVFAISFSGDTEETVEAAGSAFEAGASLIVVAGGGALAAMAGEWDVPLVPVPTTIPSPGPPSGPWPCPRWCCSSRSDCSPEPCSGWTRLSSSCAAAATSWPVPATGPRRSPGGSGGPSRSSTAPRTSGRWPPSGGRPRSTRMPRARPSTTCIRSSATTSWPDGASTGDATRQLITLVNLRHDAEHPQVSRRFAFVEDVLREVVADIVEVRAAGEGDLAQLLDLALIGDVVSLYLAGNEGIDPGPIPVLDELKAHLGPGTP